MVISKYFSYLGALISISKGLRRNAKQIFLKRPDVFIKIPSKYHITWPPTYGLNKAVKNPPSNLNELDICMPVLVAMSSNCGFYYIPNFLMLPLPSAWFITVVESYRCYTSTFLSLFLALQILILPCKCITALCREWVSINIPGLGLSWHC